MNYIDFDGVILDTYLGIFKDYLNDKSINKYIDDVTHVKNKNWEKVLEECNDIKNALEIIRSLDINNNAILTKVHSLENEGSNKIKFLRKKGIMCPIILVPYDVKKTDVVNAKNNILVDDSIFNLDDWYLEGGISYFFNKDGLDFDGFGEKNTKYPKVKSLQFLKNIK